MSTAIKHLLIFKDDTGNGWTEVHYRNSDSDNPPLQTYLTTLVDEVVPLRAALLSSDCKVIGARVSYPRTNEVASLGKKMYFGGTPDKTGVSADLSLACQFVDPSSTKSKITHLRGFWDSIESNGEYHPELDTDWDPRLDAWKAKLIQRGFGWLSKSAAISAKGEVLTYLSNVDGSMRFTITPNANITAKAGQVIQVRFSKINRSKSVLNRAFLVTVTDAATLTTVPQVAAGAFESKGRYNYRATGIAAYSALQNISLGRRAQGRPLGRAPGRLAAKPLR